MGSNAFVGVVSELPWGHFDPVEDDIHQTLADVYLGEIGDPSVPM